MKIIYKTVKPMNVTWSARCLLLRTTLQLCRRNWSTETQRFAA